MHFTRSCFGSSFSYRSIGYMVVVVGVGVVALGSDEKEKWEEQDR